MSFYNYIRWIKNVKRENGNDWAYYASTENSQFLLAFSPDHAAGARKPEQGDFIILFQTIENESIAKAGTYLTHIVEVSSDSPEPTNQPHYPIGRLVRVIARVNPATVLKSSVINMNFQHVSSGQLCKIEHFNPSESCDINKRRLIKLLFPYF